MNTDSYFIPLPERRVIEITGPDTHSFLQGLLTNDINKVSEAQALYALMLTPQGKFLFDCFVTQIGERLVLDCEADRIEELIKRLSMYKLRADVTINDISGKFEVVALMGQNKMEEEGLRPEPGLAKSFCKGMIFVDPRKVELGARAVIETENHYQAFKAKEMAHGKWKEYEKNRLSLGVPDARDMIPEKSFPLQYRMDVFNAIDFDKGCYVGQEVTARTKHRGSIRKSIFYVEGISTLPDMGTPVMHNGKQVGELRTSLDTHGLALLEVEKIKDELEVGGIALKVV